MRGEGRQASMQVSEIVGGSETEIIPRFGATRIGS
jgi:hypothetical protein